MSFDTTLKPQTANLCLVRIRNTIKKELLHYINQIYSGYLSNFSLIPVTNELVMSNSHRKLSIVVINNTNHTVMLRRGCVVGWVSPAVNVNYVTICDISVSNITDISNNVLPSVFMSPVQKLLEENKELFNVRCFRWNGKLCSFVYRRYFNSLP